jgi:hypothetical protein
MAACCSLSTTFGIERSVNGKRSSGNGASDAGSGAGGSVARTVFGTSGSVGTSNEGATTPVASATSGTSFAEFESAESLGAGCSEIVCSVAGTSGFDSTACSTLSPGGSDCEHPTMVRIASSEHFASRHRLESPIRIGLVSNGQSNISAAKFRLISRHFYGNSRCVNQVNAGYGGLTRRRIANLDAQFS